MAYNEALIKEIEAESVTTRKLLERIPTEYWEYKPHEKSFSMGNLSTIVAQMYGWITNMAKEPELDFANNTQGGYNLKSMDEVLATLDKNIVEAKEALAEASEEVMGQTWTLRNGEAIYWQAPKAEVNRGTISHMAHHRGQLTVYARLKDIPIPPIYGPTADEGAF